MRWTACELHAHTLHSDGKMTLTELASAAAKLGFECVALTDHNTMSGLADKEAAERQAGIAILPGMEWTTFHGHMVTVGLAEYVDWRQANTGNIHDGVSAVHARGGVAGLAHPFRIGSPACTGCYWEYEVEDWNDFDYIEAWSGTFAPIKTDNARAFALWTDKLNEGYRLAATSGRDWHDAAETDEPISVTYLRLEDESRPIGEEAVEALRRGRVSVTIGPLVTLEAETPAAFYRIGDVIPADKRTVTASIGIDFSVRQGHWALADPACRIRLSSNQGVLEERAVQATEDTQKIRMAVQTEGLSWMRAELWGIVRGVSALIAFTNAIYFD
ncbi:CehA/McbA family metallohydrolase [Cohnella sp. GbtcB17]|uniref:CehA/McbA family metallohydrolase n=1 Tax=Cohnella sp. GbtcB17 TaxID=2824762 RepID=UPI001C31130C|nr:CehA/McbA family metallohydrolase [Cohnella sp. GbtcB17]